MAATLKDGAQGAPEAGARFAQAFADKDESGIRSVLAADVDFRGLTPNRSWEAKGADEVVQTLLGRWLEDSDIVEELVGVETGSFADREHVAYSMRGHNEDGPFVVEQRAYYTEADGRIDWIRVLCCGFRPA